MQFGDSNNVNIINEVINLELKSHFLGLTFDNGSSSVHIIMKTSSNVENILGFNGKYSQFPDDNL
jgi:hypothetical protein